MSAATDNAGDPDKRGSSDAGNAEHPGETASTILLFDTTHTSMAAEQAIIDAGYWCDVVPKPPDAMTGLCGLAVEVRTTDIDGVRTTLKDAGLAFEIYQPEVEAH